MLSRTTIAIAAAALACTTAIATTGAQAAGATTPVSRILPTTGMTTFNLGGGVTVSTNTPSGLVSFSWNTGSSGGTASGQSLTGTSSSMTLGH